MNLNALSRAFGVVLALVPVSAVADCPVAGDLETGIELRDSDGYVYVYTRISPAVVQQDGLAPDGYAFRNLLGQGSHVLQLADLENGAIVSDSIINYSYPMRPEEMPVPEPNLRWQVGAVVNAFGDVYQEFQNQSWSPLGTFQIAECSYEVTRGTVSYKSDGDVIREEISFLPELGIGLLTAYSDASGYDERFTFTAIRKLP